MAQLIILRKATEVITQDERYSPQIRTGTWRVHVCALPPRFNVRFRLLILIIFHVTSVVDTVFQMTQYSRFSPTINCCVTYACRICGFHDDRCSYCRMGCVIADHRDTVFVRNVGAYLQD